MNIATDEERVTGCVEEYIREIFNRKCGTFLIAENPVSFFKVADVFRDVGTVEFYPVT